MRQRLLICNHRATSFADGGKLHPRAGLKLCTDKRQAGRETLRSIELCKIEFVTTGTYYIFLNFIEFNAHEILRMKINEK
jgi:hypothetical protein